MLTAGRPRVHHPRITGPIGAGLSGGLVDSRPRIASVVHLVLIVALLLASATAAVDPAGPARAVRSDSFLFQPDLLWFHDRGPALPEAPTVGQRRRRRGIAGWRDRIVDHGSVAPETLTANPLNWRLHPPSQKRALLAVIDEVGVVDSVIVNRRTGRLINGHLRVELALERGEATIPVEYVELTDDEERMVLLTFDPLGELANADVRGLEALMADLLVDDEALRSMLADLAIQNGLRLPGLLEPDAIPERPAAPSVRSGELWLLGDGHRLVVGDATDPATMELATGGQHAEVVWTDPPFGVNYVGKTPARLRIANDDPAGAVAILGAALRLAPLAPSARFYLVTPTGARLMPVLRLLEQLGWRLHEELIWLKNRITPGHADYQFGHERLLYGYTPGPGRPGRGRHTGSKWYGDNAQSSVLEFRRGAANRHHPTAKPVGLVEVCLRNSSAPGDLVLDPFAGSGTTILAADALGRRCAAIELDPGYAEVAIERFRAATGKPAVRA